MPTHTLFCGVVFRETKEFVISIPALPRPSLGELREKSPWISKYGDGFERNTSPTEAVTLHLGTVLRLDENHIDGPEYERRIASLTSLLGRQQLRWLVDHQDESPTLQALMGQRIYIAGPGLVVVCAADGHRHFPCLRVSRKRWGLYWRWVGFGLGQHGRLAVSGK